MKNIFNSVLLLSILFIKGTYLLAQSAEKLSTIQIDSVVISGASPLPGSNIPLSRQASISYLVNQEKLKQLPGQFSLDNIERHLGPVHFYKASGNDKQPSINYRGFQAAPLLGLSQGIAVYMDGIRMNDLFGDVVYWGMLPSNGLNKIELIAGSNPIFGLNSLGGALQFNTNSGFELDKNNLTFQGGQYGYKSLDVEIGIQKNKWAFLLAGNLFHETGWRDFSASSSGRIFGKFSYKTSKTISHFSLHYSKSDFLGNGSIPVELLSQNRDAIYTHKDQTDNKLALVSLHHSWLLNKKSKLQGLIYFKNRDTQTFNGDDSSYEPCEGEFEGFMCTEIEEGESSELIFDQFGNRIAVSDAVISAVNNSSSTLQKNLAVVLQYQNKSNFNGMSNRFLAGQRFDIGNAKYKANSELAKLTNTRGTIGSGIFDNDQFTDLKVKVINWSAFAADWLDFYNNKLTFQAAARLNYSNVKLRDQIGTELNGDHAYLHLNPSIGIVWHLKNDRQLFLGYSMSNRTPTPVELSCADPDDPCKLPNSFLADPPLDQVVAQTLESGWRGNHPLGQFKLVAYYTLIKNDIYFVSAGPARNSGFFRNLSRTSRKGIELEYSIDQKSWQATLTINMLNASFDESFTFNSPQHPNSFDGETIIEIGNRLPLIPSYTLKIYGNYQVNSRLRFGLLWNYYSEQFIRGDESNNLGYRLPAINYLSIDSKFRISKHLQFFGEIRNLLNLKYSTFGLLGEPDEIDEFESFEDPIFLTPASPRLVRLGIRFSW